MGRNYHPNPPFISGRVVDSRPSSEGSLAIVFLLDLSAGTTQLQVVQVDHSFEFEVQAERRYALAVRFEDPACVGVWSPQGLVAIDGEAEIFNIGRISRHVLEIDLADVPCGQTIEGSVATEAGVQLGGIPVILTPRGSAASVLRGIPEFLHQGTRLFETLTRGDGTFSFCCSDRHGWMGSGFANSYLWRARDNSASGRWELQRD